MHNSKCKYYYKHSGEHKGEPEEFGNCVYGPMRHRWAFICVMGKHKYGEKGTAKDPKHTASSVKYGVDGVMTVSGTDLSTLLMMIVAEWIRKGTKPIFPTNIQ